jgi:polar amino acid transport system substrate-binding protein
MRNAMKARRWRRGSLLGLVLAVALIAAGCGGGTATTAPAPVDGALAAQVPEAIKDDGKILIGTDPTYAPNEFLETDGKTVTGFDVELFDAVATKLGLETEWQPANFPDIIPGVQSGKYEVGVSSFTITRERKRQVYMVSYFKAGTQWATKKGNPTGIQPGNACGKRVAVQVGTVQDTDDLSTKRQDACKSQGKPAIIIDPFQGQDQATAAVVSGKDDAMLADAPAVAYAVKQTGQLELLGGIYHSAPYGYVIEKDQTKFAHLIAAAVKALITDGTYCMILDKWDVQTGAINNPAVNPKQEANTKRCT